MGVFSLLDSWALNEKRVEQSLAQIRCEDTVHQCKEWVERGECKDNPSYMVTMLLLLRLLAKCVHAAYARIAAPMWLDRCSM